MSVELSVIIPALNERENLERLIPAVERQVRDLGITAEIIVVNGPSHDGTEEAVAALGARVIPQVDRGYGSALRTGFAAAEAPYLLTMDADLSHPPTFIRGLWAKRTECDLVIASRYVPGGKPVMGGFRLLLSRILNFVFRLVLRVPVKDQSSGFRLYRKEAVSRLRLQSRDFDALEEILVLGYRHGWRLSEVPFHYMPRTTGATHAKLIRFGWAYLRTLLRMYRLRHG
jgi:dolichol-phosphate mannosyltransferase